MVFDAYTQFEESVLTAKMRMAEVYICVGWLVCSVIPSVSFFFFSIGLNIAPNFLFYGVGDVRCSNRGSFSLRRRCGLCRLFLFLLMIVMFDIDSVMMLCDDNNDLYTPPFSPAINFLISA